MSITKKDIEIGKEIDEEEKLHMVFMRTAKVGEKVGGRRGFNPEGDLENALKRFEDRWGFNLVDYYLEKKLQEAEGLIDVGRTKGLDSLMKKIIGDKQTTEFSVRDLDFETKVQMAKELEEKIGGSVVKGN